MGKQNRPDDHDSVASCLIVDGAEPTIRFLERVFGATELRRIPAAEGRSVHAEVRIDDTLAMLADADPPNRSSVPAHGRVHGTDVDAVYEAVATTGATSRPGAPHRGRREAARERCPG